MAILQPIQSEVEGKACSKCGLFKSTKDFYKHLCTKDRLFPYCKKCANKINRLYKTKYKQKYKELSRDNHLYRNYGIGLKEFNRLYQEQEGKCKICKKEKALMIDHNHNTNKNRGLLCNNCNVGLGHFKDDVESLKNAIVYLENI